MVKIKSLRYGRTVSKDYKSWRAEVEVELNDGDTLDDALAEAQKAVTFCLQEAINKGAR